jgi:uncharacterized membrane protein YjjB (DUF3815 family)
VKSILHNPNGRLCIALGATTGIGHVLFRALTSNLGPIWGLLTSVIVIGLIAASISLALEHAVKRSLSQGK